MLPEMSSSCSHASGARRGCAGLAAANALNGCDLLALIVVQGDPAQVAESIRRELEKSSGTQVLPFPSASLRRSASHAEDRTAGARAASPDLLRCFLNRGQACDGRTRRSVLLWPEVEAFLRDCPERFDGLFDTIVESLSAPAGDPRGSAIQKAVLVGGTVLLPRINRMVMQVPADVRFRYILVR